MEQKFWWVSPSTKFRWKNNCSLPRIRSRCSVAFRWWLFRQMSRREIALLFATIQLSLFHYSYIVWQAYFVNNCGYSTSWSLNRSHSCSSTNLVMWYQIWSFHSQMEQVVISCWSFPHAATSEFKMHYHQHKSRWHGIASTSCNWNKYEPITWDLWFWSPKS